MTYPQTAASLIWHPGLGVYSTADAIPLPADPDTQVAETIQVMQRYAQEDSTSPQVVEAARTALGESSTGDPVEAVWNYVRSRMTFQEDAVRGRAVEDRVGVPVIEVLVRPRDILTWGVGDCDDYVTFGASLLLALGVSQVAFATVAGDGEHPEEYSHVYLVAYPDSQTRIPMDLSHGKTLGWEVPNRYGKLREWRVGSGIGLGEALVAFSLAWWIGTRGKGRA